MKVSVPFLVIVLLFTSFSIPPRAGQAEGITATISSDSVNMRQGPGLAFPTVATANKGDTYEVLDNEYGWLKLQLASGQEGWVAEWLTIQESTPTPEVDTESTNTYYVITDELRIRAAAGTDYDVVGTLKKGDSVNVLSESGEWLEISMPDGTSGWAYAEFIDQQQQSSQQTSEGESLGTISVDRLNVRNDFSSEGAVIGSFNQGDIVLIDEEQYGWLLVEGNGLKGWVSSSYVQYQATTNDSTEPIEMSSLEDSSIVIMVDALTVRNEPSRSGDSIGSVNQGDSFTVEEISGDWYSIEYQSGEFGWIASWYTEQGTRSSHTQSNSSTADLESVTILYNGSNIRSQASVESDVVTLAQAGEQYPVVSQQGDWFEIRLSDDTTGFIANWIVAAEDSTVKEFEEEEEEREQEEKVIDSIADATIVIDAGHGGRDGGSPGASGTHEKPLTLRTAEMLYHKLSSTGAKVIMTRQDDRYIDLNSRVATSQQYQADAFISIHYDAHDDRSIGGYTTYFYGGIDKTLANSVHKGLEGQMTISNRGVQFGDYFVLRENSSAAVLLELGYISNPSEEALVNNDRFRDIATTGIYNGLVEYFENY
ncbi:SH3 domain-containing protein [Jeotgalibacillus marinus]|uniref:SH3 domain-containing protein n=1 Tax=Jeotgalibacillus marinus TaxID=86667 RepID=A0ABV3PZM6_9BACL